MWCGGGVWRREWCAVGLLCCGWYAASSASNVVGKLALQELPLPLTLSVVQLLAATLLTPPALALAGVRQAPYFPPAFYCTVLIPLAVAKFLTIVFTQVSLWKVPISFAHTVKATTPLWTAGLAWALFGERQSPAVCAALLVIALGVGVASATELQFDSGGLGAALAAAALLSLQHLYSKRVLRDTGVHHLRLLLTLSRLALPLLAPAWAALEARALLAAVPPRGWERAGVLLAADGALAWLQAVAAFSVLSRVSPLAYAVASAAKRAAVVGASLVLLRNPAPPANLAGMALAALGVLAYNRAKLHDGLRSQRAARRPLLPV